MLPERNNPRLIPKSILHFNTKLSYRFEVDWTEGFGHEFHCFVSFTCPKPG